MKRYKIKCRADYTDWDRLVHELENIPLTYYPGLLIKLAEISLEKGVWQEGRMQIVMKNVEESFYESKRSANAANQT